MRIGTISLQNWQAIPQANCFKEHAPYCLHGVILEGQYRTLLVAQIIPVNVLLQALVEHFIAAGQPQAVERAVLHMDIASLDLNQVSSSYLSCCTCSAHLITVTSGLSRADHGNMVFSLV